MFNPFTVIGGIIVAAVLLVGGIVYAGVSYDKSVARRVCSEFSEQTGRETKFYVYNWDRWDCLTPTGDGKWISTDNLREIVK